MTSLIYFPIIAFLVAMKRVTRHQSPVLLYFMKSMNAYSALLPQLRICLWSTTKGKVRLLTRLWTLYGLGHSMLSLPFLLKLCPLGNLSWLQVDSIVAVEYQIFFGCNSTSQLKLFKVKQLETGKLWKFFYSTPQLDSFQIQVVFQDLKGRTRAWKGNHAENWNRDGTQKSRSSLFL